jgi:hypothetical protein
MYWAENLKTAFTRIRSTARLRRWMKTHPCVFESQPKTSLRPSRQTIKRMALAGRLAAKLSVGRSGLASPHSGPDIQSMSALGQGNGKQPIRKNQAKRLSSLRLMISSVFVGCTIRRSIGFVPPQR